MNIREVLLHEGAQLLKEGWPLVDVRTPGEWNSIHATGSINIPLDEMSESRVQAQTSCNKILLICQSGSRSRKACERLADLKSLEVASVAGGVNAWLSAGLPVVRGKGVISIERQVRIGAGALVVSGTIAGFILHPGFLIVPLFIGAGLVFAGITDFCGMGLLLARMPWNQENQSKKSSCELRKSA